MEAIQATLQSQFQAAFKDSPGKWEKLDENNNAVSLENPFDQLYQYWRVVQDRINFSHLPPEIRVPVTQLAVLSEISKDDLVAEKVAE